MKLNGTHHFLVCADDIRILDGSVPAIKGHEEALVVASKEIGLEVNIDKTMYMDMSRDQNAGRSHRVEWWKFSDCWEKP